jgi:hypothetical protein
MKTDALAAALKADILRPSTPPPTSASIDCFLCSRSFPYRGHKGDNNGRFCSDRCRQAYDAGYRRAEPVDPFKVTTWRVVAGSNPGYQPSTPMRAGKAGWHITCPGCQREFESKGLRCCSAECERRSREQAERLALMAEVGMEPKAKRPAASPRSRNGGTAARSANGPDFAISTPRGCDRKSAPRLPSKAPRLFSSNSAKKCPFGGLSCDRRNDPCPRYSRPHAAPRS